MDSYKELKINKRPSVISFTHHSYLHAILESEQFIGEDLFRFKVKDYNNYAWNIDQNNVSLKCIGEDEFRVTASPFSEDEICSIMRLCDSQTFLSVELWQQLYTWSECSFSIVISEDQKPKDNCIKFQHVSSSGISYKYLEECVKIRKTNECHMPIQLSIQRNNEMIYYRLLNDRNEWEDVYESTLPSEWRDRKLYIGILADAGENEFYNWKYSNYIQLRYRLNTRFISLDYYNITPKNANFHFLNNFFEFINIDPYEAESLYGGICNCIEWLISKNRYVGICLDEYYIPNREAYKRNHYIHQNIAFGYNKISKTIKLLGYNIYLEECEISYHILEEAFTASAKESNLEVIEYKPNDILLTFNKQSFSNMIESYLYSQDTSINMSNIVGFRKEIYGLNVLRELLKPENKVDIVSDKRVSFIIYEHNLIMKERLKFLKEKNIYPNIDFDLLITEFDEILSLSICLKNLALKEFIRTGEENNILRTLKQLYENEIIFYTKFNTLIH